MEEWIGQCAVCEKDVYCLDGFLNGVKEEELCCFECADGDE